MPVQFDDSIVYDSGTAQTVEESFRIYAAWAQLHDFSFEKIIDVNSSNVATGSDWSEQNIIETVVPFDVTVHYTVDGAGHGLVLRYDDATGDHLLFGLQADGKLVIYEVISSISTLILSIPTDGPLYGDVTVMFRQQRFSDDETDLWITFSMWIDDALIGTHAIYTGTVDNGDYYIGVTAQSTSRTFTNISVPQLTEFAEWSSVDPGESPLGGLERAIEGRYVKYFIRFDGSIRAWRSRTASSQRTFVDDDDVHTRTITYDKRQLYNHVRMLGGYAQAEFIRTDLIAKFGHKFVEINNPYLITESACRRESERQIFRMEEMYIAENIGTPFTPTIEIEDRITTPSGDRIITSRRWIFSEALIEQELQTRLYTAQYGV